MPACADLLFCTDKHTMPEYSSHVISYMNMFYQRKNVFIKRYEEVVEFQFFQRFR